MSNYVGQGVTLGAWFFLTPFILRELGSVVYGLWTLVGSLMAYGSLLDFGIWGAVIRHIAAYQARDAWEEANGLLATVLVLYTLLGAVTVGASLVLAPLFPLAFGLSPLQAETATGLVMLMGSAVGLFIPCMTTLALLRGLQRYDLVNAVSIIGTLFEVVGTVAVLRAGGGVFGLVAVNVLGMVAMQVPALWFIHRVAPALRLGWRGASREHARLVLGYSWPLFVSDLAGRLQTRSDEITIGAFLPLRAVAPYAVARKLSEVTHLLTKQFMKVLLPLASELHAAQDRPRLRALYLTGSRLTLAICLPIGGTLALLARPLLDAWVGPAFGSYGPIVVLLTLATLAATSQWPAIAVLQGMARHRWLAASALTAGLANLALSVALVRPLGLTGVALGTLIPTVMESLGWVLPYTLHVLGVSRRDALREIWLPTLLPVLPMLVTLHGLQQLMKPLTLPTLLLVAISGPLVYGLAYLAFGASAPERAGYRTLLHEGFQGVSRSLRRV